MSKVSRFVFAASAAVALAGSAQAHIEYYFALLSGPAEAPPNNSPGTGWSLVTIDLDLATMRVETAFSGLTGTVTAAHIHGPTSTPFAGTAGVMTSTPTFSGFPSGVSAGTYDRTFDLTIASTYNNSFIAASGGTISGAMNRLIDAMDQGRAYFNLHSTTFGGGEIRGFYNVVPSPASAGLLALGGLIASRRRRA